mmetsp:Transcript_8438/g.14220  ORF Transcript_8438/g.14220 Transcript_8438/m.14220 type:complete len:190 (-) Transcript_8438:425-994(-)
MLRKSVYTMCYVCVWLLALATAAGNKELVKAIMDNNAAMVNIAVKSGAKVNEPDTEGLTPLLLATVKGKAKALKALLKAGADSNGKGADGMPLIHVAAMHGQAKVVQTLITHGLDASEMHSDGLTPLHRACLGDGKEHAEVAKVLLNANVPWDEKTAEGKIPLELTANAFTRKVVESFKGRAPSTKAEL